jgi:hypothetical protein
MTEASAGGPDLIRVRMSPDYSSALWPDGPPDRRGSDAYAILTPDLRVEMSAWIDDWESWHDCEQPDDLHEGWIVEGRRLHAEIERELAPYGFVVRADFEARGCHKTTNPS